MARITLPDGRRRAYYGKSRAEAAHKLQRAQAAIAGGLLPAGERLTVGPLLEVWLKDNAKHKVRVKTYVRYQELVRLHIAPEIGRISLVKLTP